MLTQTLDETMAKAQKVEQVTRATRFGNVFKTVVKDKTAQDEVIMRKKIDKFTKKGFRSFDKKIEPEDNFITEDPEEIIINVDFSKGDSGLPFFRSITEKLNKIYG